MVPRFGQAEQLLSAADLVVGGSGSIVAHGLARLGTPVRMVATVGSDLFADLLRERLAAAGVDVSGLQRHRARDRCHGRPLGRRRASDPHVPGRDRRPGRRAGPGGRRQGGRRRRAARSRQLALPASEACCGSLRGAPPGADPRAQTSLDTNDDPADRWEAVAGVLEHVDVLLPNAREAEALAARSSDESVGDAVAAARVLAAQGPTVVVKLGADGRCPGRARRRGAASSRPDRRRGRHDRSR